MVLCVKTDICSIPLPLFAQQWLPSRSDMQGLLHLISVQRRLLCLCCLMAEGISIHRITKCIDNVHNLCHGQSTRVESCPPQAYTLPCALTHLPHRSCRNSLSLRVVFILSMQRDSNLNKKSLLCVWLNTTLWFQRWTMAVPELSKLILNWVSGLILYIRTNKTLLFEECMTVLPDAVALHSQHVTSRGRHLHRWGKEPGYCKHGRVFVTAKMRSSLFPQELWLHEGNALWDFSRSKRTAAFVMMCDM